MFAGKKSAQIREILISESAWEEMTCLFAPSLAIYLVKKSPENALRWQPVFPTVIVVGLNGVTTVRKKQEL
ncbi:hypothetical protein [uncultured Enterobacter sp.]|uniref:hypothetical protein n=1 Tax=uncultured Enterobacter sp. TaxID=238202 RepID=UPI0028059DE2|nr:hypothetical protein [uncultured Enterobacter sp.]